MRKRETTAEERALFRAVLAGRVSLRSSKKGGEGDTKLGAAVANKRSEVPGGINGSTRDKLIRGALRPDARIDLHGLTETAAHRAMSAFLVSAINRGARLVLVITGKGARKIDPYAPFDMELEMRERGVLKAMVPRWLGEPPLAGLIAEVRPAHIRHGGAGALYVYLRKRPAG